MADLNDEQIKAGLEAANAMDSTFEFGDGSTAAEREAACIDAFRHAAGLPEWESYQLEGIGMVRRRKHIASRDCWCQPVTMVPSKRKTRDVAGILHFLTPQQMAEEIVRLDAVIAAQATAGMALGATPSPEGFGKVDLIPPPMGATRPAKAARKDGVTLIDDQTKQRSDADESHIGTEDSQGPQDG